MTPFVSLFGLFLGFQAVATPLTPPAAPAVSFTFDRPQVQTTHYEIILGEDGKGIYRAKTLQGVAVESAITVSPAATKRIFEEAHATDGFRKVQCETHLKNMAQTGKKVLTWNGGQDSGSCTYNYSDDKEIAGITAIFQGIAATMEMGQRLAYLHRYDRLGLDAEITGLGNSVKSGWAGELQNIEPILKKIVNDVSLMERVRSKAEALMASGK